MSRGHIHSHPHSHSHTNNWLLRISLDPESEAHMMSVIREKFRDVTVIAIAHRLDTITDFDKVIVLDSGRVVEVGVPRDLLSQPSSVFRSLYESSSH